MAEDQGNKSELPTPHKLREARKKGNVAFSKDIPILTVTIAVAVFLYLMGGQIIRHLDELMLLSYSVFHLPAMQGFAVLMNKTVDFLVAIVIPLCSIVVIAAIAGTVGHIGFIFSTEKIKFDFNNINPAEGFKKIFSKKTLVETLKSVFILAIIGYLCYLIIMADLPLILHSVRTNIPTIFKIAKDIIINLLLISLIIYVIFSVIDFIIQRSFYIKQLMMSMEDINKERKEIEGNPEIAAKRKELHKEIIDGEFVKNVNESNVVISNPTRICVGIAFHLEKIPIPFVTIKGMGYTAQAIRHVALLYDVPIVESKYLARDLYQQTEAGQFIPRTLFKAVAEILAPIIEEENRKSKTYYDSDSTSDDDIEKL